MNDEEKLQSEIDLVSGDETGTSTRGATTGTDEGKGADDSGETDKGGTGTVSGSDGDGDGGGSSSVAGYTLYVTANPAAGASNIYVKKKSDSGFGSTQIQLIANTQYTLGVTAAQGHTFSGWYLNNSLYSNNTTFNYTASGRIGADMTFEARFSVSGGVASNTLTLSVDPTGSGTVSGGGTFPANANVTITATPNTGYTFMGWYESTGGNIANSKAISFSSTYNFILKKTTSLIAKFKPAGETTHYISPDSHEREVTININIPNALYSSFSLNNILFNNDVITQYESTTSQFSMNGIRSRTYSFIYDFGENTNIEEIDLDLEYEVVVNGVTKAGTMTSNVLAELEINEK